MSSINREPEHARVVWRAEDVQTLQPDWELNKCEAWLDANGKYIAEAMVLSGWAAMEALLNEKL